MRIFCHSDNSNPRSFIFSAVDEAEECRLKQTAQCVFPKTGEDSLMLVARRGDSHMKQTGMLVVSLRGVNFGFWSRLGCFGQSANILCHQGLV